jgi:RHS repeat-associated protein
VWISRKQSSLPDKYDFENHLTERSEPQKHVRIIYDGDGHRVRKIVSTPTNTVTTYFLVDTLNLTGYAQVMEELTTDTSNPLLSTPQVTRVYSYGLDLIGQEQFVNGSWQLSFHGYDGHGNVRFLTSDTGAVTDTYDYDAFGNLIAAIGTTPNAYLYCGEQLDFDLGLYFLRARYMNPETGRFWTMDDFEGSPNDPLTLHKYTYANCEPITGYDPSGRLTTSQVLAAFFVANVLFTIHDFQSYVRAETPQERGYYGAMLLLDVTGLFLFNPGPRVLAGAGTRTIAVLAGGGRIYAAIPATVRGIVAATGIIKDLINNMGSEGGGGGDAVGPQPDPTSPGGQWTSSRQN